VRGCCGFQLCKREKPRWEQTEESGPTTLASLEEEAGGRWDRAGLPTTVHGIERRVEDTTVESTGTTSGFAGSGFCSAGMLSSAAARSGIAELVVS